MGVDNECILRVTSSKEDLFFNEELLFYVEVDPRMLVYLAEAGVKGTRHPLPEWKVLKEPMNPLSPLKLWLPAVLVREAWPDLVQAYEEFWHYKFTHCLLSLSRRPFITCTLTRYRGISLV